jgi:hypothetical protein
MLDGNGEQHQEGESDGEHTFHGKRWIIAGSIIGVISIPSSQIHRDRSLRVTSRNPFRGPGQKRKDHPRHSSARLSLYRVLSLSFLSCCSPQIHQFHRILLNRYRPQSPNHLDSLPKPRFQLAILLSPALGSPEPSLIGKTLQHPYIHPSAFFPPAYPAFAPPFHKVTTYLLHSKLDSSKKFNPRST